MRVLPKRSALYLALAATSLFALSDDALAVPSFSRRYGEECSTCHTLWGALTPAGTTFKLSGYRAIFGKELTQITPDIQISKGVTIPATLPLSFVTGVGIESRKETRSTSGAAAPTSVSTSGTSLALEDASIFMTAPLGKHLAAFVEFPMYETRAWEFTPTGNYEARFNQPTRQLKFGTESPTFEVAKFFWNNVAGDSMPRDSVNLLAGITHLPLAYSPGKVRLSVNQYLVYERTALDLISPRRVSNGVLAGDSNDYLFRLSEPQVMAEAYGMLTFGKPVTDVGKSDTLWGEYHVGMSNGSNAKAANNSAKDFYGRFVMRYKGQSLGLFGVVSPDTYSDDLRNTAALESDASRMAANYVPGTGIMSGLQGKNKSTRFGPDMTLSLAPWGIPLSLENQLLISKETNPTGFNKAFSWRGGFSQLNWRINKNSIAYVRYDYIKGDAFDDTNVVANGATGITRTSPREKDIVVGYQTLLDQNIKFVGEYRSHRFDDTASGALSANAAAALGTTAVNQAHLKDNGITLRVMVGF
ncbi:MAG: hypothetical protein ACXWJM_01425 [Ramlibacter sp.]